MFQAHHDGPTDGELAFAGRHLWFPLDLTADICREHGVNGHAAFDAAMARQKEQARAAGKFKMAANLEYSGPATAFHGYESLEPAGQGVGAVQGWRCGQ